MTLTVALTTGQHYHATSDIMIYADILGGYCRPLKGENLTNTARLLGNGARKDMYVNIIHIL